MCECECANAARMTKSTLAAKYRSLMARKSHKKAIVAVAHKMIRLIYVLLARKQAYLINTSTTRTSSGQISSWNGLCGSTRRSKDQK